MYRCIDKNKNFLKFLGQIYLNKILYNYYIFVKITNFTEIEVLKYL